MYNLSIYNNKLIFFLAINVNLYFIRIQIIMIVLFDDAIVHLLIKASQFFL